MKIKFNSEKIKELAPYFVFGAVTLGISGGMAAYYLPDNFHDNVKQESDCLIDSDKVEIIEGEVYYIFDEGEHKVKMSQNDAFYRKVETVEGYEITSVEVNGWRDNSQVTFVNKVPVRVKATSNRNGKMKW